MTSERPTDCNQCVEGPCFASETGQEMRELVCEIVPAQPGVVIPEPVSISNRSDKFLDKFWRIKD
ncbi:hypothetical protein ACFL0Y_04845 [Patescibacteria group bacterium]